MSALEMAVVLVTAGVGGYAGRCLSAGLSGIRGRARTRGWARLKAERRHRRWLLRSSPEEVALRMPPRPTPPLISSGHHSPPPILTNPPILVEAEYLPERARLAAIKRRMLQQYFEAIPPAPTPRATDNVTHWDDKTSTARRPWDRTGW